MSFEFVFHFGHYIIINIVIKWFLTAIFGQRQVEAYGI